MSSKTLHLVVTRHWFDKIASGEKIEDFREIKPYWIKRLWKFNPKEGEEILSRPEYAMPYGLVVIRAGYQKNAPTLTMPCLEIRITDADEETDLGKGRFFAIRFGYEKVNNVI